MLRMNQYIFLPALIAGLVTGVIALAGVIYTQHQAAKREDNRWTREGSRVQEDRQWQREIWARDHRREAHVAFLAEQRRLDHWMMMYTRVGVDGVETPKEDWAEPLGRRLLDVQVFGSQDAAVAAQRLYQATRQLETGAVGHMMQADQAIETYRRLVQRDLGLTEMSLPAWGSEDEPDWGDVGNIPEAGAPPEPREIAPSDPTTTSRPPRD
jgi:hypothetical protein